MFAMVFEDCGLFCPADAALGSFTTDTMGSLLVSCPETTGAEQHAERRRRQRDSIAASRPAWQPSRKSPNLLTPKHNRQIWIKPPDPSVRPWASRKPPSAHRAAV